MEFSNLPKHRKEQLAQLTTGTSRIVLSLLMGLFGVGLIWSVDSALPPAQEFPEYSQVVPDVPWDYKLFEDVDYANPATTEQVAYGRRLIMETADYLGPNSSKPFAGNNLDCNSCHLDGGTKPFAAPFVTVPSQFPQFRNRENKEGTIQERINGCMQRSMNGRPLPEDSEELAAMVAYMEWLSLDKPRGEKINGNKFLKVNISRPSGGSKAWRKSVCATLYYLPSVRWSGPTKPKQQHLSVSSTMGTGFLQPRGGYAPSDHGGSVYKRKYAFRNHSGRTTAFR